MPHTFMVSPRPRWLVPLQPFTAAGPTILTASAGNVAGWMSWGEISSALVFVVINEGGGSLNMLPQASFDASVVETGVFAPTQSVVAAGECVGDRYGIDEYRPYWRLNVDGASNGRWGVMHISRNP